MQYQLGSEFLTLLSSFAENHKQITVISSALKPITGRLIYACPEYIHLKVLDKETNIFYNEYILSYLILTIETEDEVNG